RVGIHHGNQHRAGQALQVSWRVHRRYVETESEANAELRPALGAVLSNVEPRRQQCSFRYRWFQERYQVNPIQECAAGPVLRWRPWISKQDGHVQQVVEFFAAPGIRMG